MKTFKYVASTLIPIIVLISGSAAAGGFAQKLKVLLMDQQTHRAPANVLPTQLDSMATRCLTCHDDSSKRPISVTRIGGSRQGAGLARDSHPVGMLYDDSAMRDPSSYKPSGALPPDMQLVGGQVTCISCHTTKNSAEPDAEAGAEPRRDSECLATGELVGARSQSGLCLACHTL